MNLNRRELITASAGTGLYFGLGLAATAAATNDLITRNIPGTGEELPVVGMGTNRWVAAGSQSEMEALAETLRTFNRLGGRVIDTAPSYRTSEKALGNLINEMNMRNAFFIATKVDKEGSKEGIDRMKDSMQKLGTEQLDLMQVHNLRDADAQLTTMFEWKESGVLRYVGITTSRIDQFAEMERLMNDFPLDFIQVNYSLAQQQAAERILPTAIDRNIAVLVNRPFGNGQLFKTVAKTSLPNWSTDFGCNSWAQFFLQYVVSHPAVTCAIPGMTKPEHVVDNMGAAHGLLPDPDQRRQQAAFYASI